MFFNKVFNYFCSALTYIVVNMLYYVYFSLTVVLSCFGPIWVWGVTIMAFDLLFSSMLLEFVDVQ